MCSIVEVLLQVKDPLEPLVKGIFFSRFQISNLVIRWPAVESDVRNGQLVD